MFVRYLSGGIGHLKQFPPANNNDEDTTHKNDDTVAEVDDFITAGITRDHGNSEEDDEEVGEDDGIDEESDLETEEQLDEETGNVY